LLFDGTGVDIVSQSNDCKARPNYPAKSKQRLATAAACETGVPASNLVGQQDIYVNSLLKWRRDLRAGLFTESVS